MKIRLKCIGDLREYFGREPEEIEITENAVMEDLFPVIEERSLGRSTTKLTSGARKEAFPWCSGILGRKKKI